MEIRKEEIVNYYRKLKHYIDKLNNPKLEKLFNSFVEKLGSYSQVSFMQPIENKYNFIGSGKGEGNMEHKNCKKEPHEKKLEENVEEKEETKKKNILRLFHVSLDDVLDFIAGEKRPPARR